MMRLGLGLAVATLLAAAPSITHAGTIDDVRNRGVLNCGVNEGLVGFAKTDSSGVWHGFDVDICRAISAAVFGDPDKVNFVPLSSATRFDALANGDIDVLSRNSTWTMSRDTNLGLDFAGIAYYDGQGFLTQANYGMRSALELFGARLCVVSSTTSEVNAAAYFGSKGIDVTFMTFDNRPEALEAYSEERCDAITADQSALASDRSLLDDPDRHVILPEVISKEPLGPVTRDDDPAWTDVVRWTLFGLINAEEMGLTSTTMMSVDQSKVSATKMGQPAAQALNLEDDWLVNVIAAVGNYGEIFDRNLGVDTALGIARGINSPWNAGGILYAPPMP